jgi:hypothetical protein
MRNGLLPKVVAWLSLMAVALAACTSGAQTVTVTSAAPTAPATPTNPAPPTVAATPTVAAPPTAAATATALPAPTAASFADPFAYCAAVGTIDQPDARYTGPKTSDVIFKGFLKAAGLDVNGNYPDAMKQMTIWRCMDKQVYACNFGANLPCDSKADTNNTPTQPMADFCKATPGADFIPMAVTGHATIYSWHCVKDAPAVLDQIDKPDAAGYLTLIWYPIQATSPAPSPTAPAGGSAE